MNADLAHPELEPMVAHGSRMSWAGLLRPGDEFCPAVRSRLAWMRSRDGPPLRRYFGAWSERFRRFTVNLSSPRVSVRVVGAESSRGDGILGLVHWVRRSDMLRVGPGGVCYADGWPEGLWQSFLSARSRLPGATVGEKLAGFVDSNAGQNVPVVAEWRALLRNPGRRSGPSGTHLGTGWVPVPAALEVPGGPQRCILSWSPSPVELPSLSEGLASIDAGPDDPDLAHQAAYYLECTLSRLHGVRFGRFDSIQDRRFERIRAVRELESAYRDLESRRIADPIRGRLDRFG